MQPLIESEIQKLLGNIKVRTSSIKETLKKQKDVIISDGKPEEEADAEAQQKDIETVDFGDCSVIVDKEELNDEEATSELNTTIIRTGEKKADVDRSTVSLSDVTIDISQTDILPQTDLEEKKEGQEGS